MAGEDTARADFYASDRSLTDSFDLLQIRVPCAPIFVVCMADIVSEAGTFSTDCTYFRHEHTLLNY